MDGIHDLGGMAGFGDITPETGEPVFHQPWQGRAFAMNLIAIGILRTYNADEYRHALERMLPLDYLQASYYERVLTGVASLLVEKNVLTEQELTSKVDGRFPLASPVAKMQDDGKNTPTAPRFKVGDTVHVKDIHPRGHTRVPQYVRGHQGQVIDVAPFFSFPDAAAHDLPFRKEPTYHVLFEAKYLWHDDDTNNETVVVDLWESYLEETS